MAAETRPLAGGKHLEYLGRPLVRQGETICYGDMSERCVLVLEIFSRDQATNLPNMIVVQILDSKDSTKILKQTKKSSLSDAFKIGLVWLERELQEA